MIRFECFPVVKICGTVNSKTGNGIEKIRPNMKSADIFLCCLLVGLAILWFDHEIIASFYNSNNFSQVSTVYGVGPLYGHNPISIQHWAYFCLSIKPKMAARGAKMWELTVPQTIKKETWLKNLMLLSFKTLPTQPKSMSKKRLKISPRHYDH